MGMFKSFITLSLMLLISHQSLAEEPALYNITSRDGKSWGLIDSTGRVVLEPRYAVITEFKNGVAGVCTEKGAWGFINSEGRLIGEPRFSMPVPIMRMAWHGPYGPVNTIIATEGMICVHQGGKYGFIDQSGAVIVEPRYDSALGFSEGLAAVAVGKKWGFINAKVEMVIEPSFDSVRKGFTGGIAVVWLGSKQGCIDSRGRTVLECKYGYIKILCGGDLAAAWEETNRQYLLFNKKGKRISTGYEIKNAASLLDKDGAEIPGIAGIQKEWAWGIIDAKGKLLVEHQFEELKDHIRFHENLMEVTAISGAWKGKSGYINSSGRIAIEPQFKKVSPFSEGLAGVQLESGRWGFIDTTGKTVITIPEGYELPGMFSSGRSLLRSPHGNPYALIDGEGKLHPIDKKFDASLPQYGLIEISLHNPPCTRLGIMDMQGKWVLGPGNYRDLFVRDGGVIFVKFSSRRLGKQALIHGLGCNRIEDFAYYSHTGKLLWKGFQYVYETDAGR